MVGDIILILFGAVYVGCSIYSVKGFYSTRKYILKRLKEEGYILDENKTFGEKVKSVFQVLGISLNPVMNITTGSYLHNSMEEAYNYVKSELLETGKIKEYEVVFETELEEDKKAEETQEVEEKVTVSFDNMTISEKRAYLEQKRQELLNNFRDSFDQNISHGR